MNTSSSNRIARTALACALLVTFACTLARDAWAQGVSAETMTNASVIEMVSGSLPRDLIIAKVKSTNPGYDLTSTGLVQLTKSKVHRSVIEAMMATAQDARARRGGSDDEVLKNEDIARMVAGNVDDKIIYAKIQNTRSAFDLTSSGMVWLHNNKVDSDIIKFMMAPPPVAAPAIAAPVTIRESQVAVASAPAASVSNPTTTKAASDVPPVARVSKPAVAISKIPTEPGIYIYGNDGSGYAFQLIERTNYTAGKTSGFLGNAFSYGIAKIKWKAVVHDSAASTRTSDASAEFYFVFENTTATLGNASSIQTMGRVTNPKEFQLVRFEVQSSTREVVVASGNSYGTQSGTEDKANVPFKVTRLKPGVYRVVPDRRMTAGEYAFVTGIGGAYGAATMSKLFDFGIGNR